MDSWADSIGRRYKFRPDAISQHLFKISLVYKRKSVPIIIKGPLCSLGIKCAVKIKIRDIGVGNFFLAGVPLFEIKFIPRAQNRRFEPE